MGYELSVKYGFAAAHQLRGYKGECENLHGHNWNIEVFVVSDTLNDIGIVLDFREIKSMMEDIVSELDHSVLNEHKDFISTNPTSENLACWIYKKLALKIEQFDASVSRVKVWETENCSATYME